MGRWWQTGCCVLIAMIASVPCRAATVYLPTVTSIPIDVYIPSSLPSNSVVISIYRYNNGTRQQLDFSDGVFGGTITTPTAIMTWVGDGLWSYVLNFANVTNENAQDEYLIHTNNETISKTYGGKVIHGGFAARLDADVSSRLSPTVPGRTLDVTAANKVAGVVLTDTVTTYTGNTPQTGDAFARLGAPAGASVSADIAAVKAETASIYAAVDTEIGTLVTRLPYTLPDLVNGRMPSFVGEYLTTEAPIGSSAHPTVTVSDVDAGLKRQLGYEGSVTITSSNTSLWELPLTTTGDITFTGQWAGEMFWCSGFPPKMIVGSKNDTVDIVYIDPATPYATAPQSVLCEVRE